MALRAVSLRRCAAAVCLATAVTSCGVLDGPVEPVGACTLEVGDAVTGTAVASPYVFRWDPPPGGATALFEGEGWRAVTVVSIAPNGARGEESRDGQLLALGVVGHRLNQQGTWRFEFHDEEAGCFRALQIDVRP